jgi:VCBS repeat-containing protein
LDNVYQVSVTASDGLGGSTVQNLAVTVTAVNDNNPLFTSTATPSVAENTAAVVTLAATDADLAAQPVSFAISGGADQNRFQIIGGNQLQFVTAPDFENPTDVGANNVYNVDVTASDGLGGSTVQNLTVTVTDVNEAPVVNAATFTVAENSANGTAVGTVIAADPDAGQTATLSYSITSGNTNNGFAIDANTGVITVANSAALDFETTPQFLLTVEATDNGTPALSGTNTITIDLTNVNEAPVVNANTFTLAENSANGTTVGTVVAVDLDAGQTATLTYSITGGNTNNGFAIDANTGVITVANSAALDFEVTPSFSLTVQATDNGTPALSGTNSITINLTDVNEAPVANNDGPFTVQTGTTLTITAPGVLVNDTDVDTAAENLTAELVSGVAHGTLALNSNGSFTYTPAAGYTGPDSFSYRVNDGEAVNNLSNVATVAIDVAAEANQAPVAVSDTFNTNEDTALVVNRPGVLANDTDVDSATLTAALVAGPQHGALNLNTDGSFTYTPNVNFNGQDSFTYKSNNGSSDSNVATISITITSVNDAPHGADKTVTTLEDTLYTFSAADFGFTDPNDSPANSLLAVKITTLPTAGKLTYDGANVVAGQFISVADLNMGKLVFTPAADANGNAYATFTFQVQDDGGTANGGVDMDAAPKVFMLNVTPINDAPVAVNDTFTASQDTALVITAPGVLGNDTDIDSSILTAALVVEPQHGTLTLITDGSFTYTPGPGFSGSDTFTYQVSDATELSNIATVTIDVAAANFAPTANAGADQTVRLGSLVTLDGTGSSDPDNDSLSYSWTQTGGPSVNLTGGNTATPSFTPTVEGIYTFSLVVNDGEVSSLADSVTITVPLLDDLDGNGVVNPDDLHLLKARLNTAASGPNDLFDLDGDGQITGQDIAKLARGFTHQRGAKIK